MTHQMVRFKSISNQVRHRNDVKPRYNQRITYLAYTKIKICDLQIDFKAPNKTKLIHIMVKHCLTNLSIEDHYIHIIEINILSFVAA